MADGKMTAVARMCLAHYEELRGRVLAGCSLGSRLGFSLLLGSGMAAWMEAWSRCSQVEIAAPPSRAPDRIEPLADECRAGVVGVLASMTLGNLTEATP